MSENISKILSARNYYIDQLDKDILENIKIIEESEKEFNEINTLMQDIKLIGNYPEKEALIPLSKNFYMKGRLIHSGEYYVQKSAHPDSYVALKTYDQTLSSLNSDMKQKKKDIDKARYSQFQLEERRKVLVGDLDVTEKETNDNLPEKIVSDNGIAVKVGDFYEILEYEN